MQELGLFESYLIQVRQRRLQESHQTLLADANGEGILRARTLAFEAELVQQLLVALRALHNDPGVFIKEHLKDHT